MNGHRWTNGGAWTGDAAACMASASSHAHAAWTAPSTKRGAPCASIIAASRQRNNSASKLSKSGHQRAGGWWKSRRIYHRGVSKNDQTASGRKADEQRSKRRVMAKRNIMKSGAWPEKAKYHQWHQYHVCGNVKNNKSENNGNGINNENGEKYQRNQSKISVAKNIENISKAAKWRRKMAKAIGETKWQKAK
jgi:hypothetical protein